MRFALLFYFGDFLNSKKKYLSSAFVLLASSVLVKIIGAVYKIPLTAFIGAVGRGYFATAYNLYLPLHAVIMGALPIALSRLVSKYCAKEDIRMISSLRRGAFSMFAAAGVLGTAILLLAAYPYSVYIASSPKSVYTIVVLAPSLMFSCFAACYRGYFEGFLDMIPTAVSQTLEAVFKLIFGLLFAKYSMAYLYNQYVSDGEILGAEISSREQALSFIFPFSSAAAMLGVTAGSLISLIYIIVYSKIKRGEYIKTSGREGRRELFNFSLPIMISCCVQSVFQFLDTATIQLALKKIDVQTLKQSFIQSVNLSNTSDGDMVTYVWGLFCTALDFKNLIPGITMALGVCAVPAICREFERKSCEKTETLINSVYKYTALLSIFSGGFLALCAKDVLSVFYLKSSPDIVIGCESVVKYFAISAPFYSLASIAVYCVQAVGKPEKSILSYIISGVIRCVLNYALVKDGRFILLGAVISGAVGYAVLFFMNMRITCRISKTKFRLSDTLIKPAAVGSLTCFLCNFTYSVVADEKNIVFKLLIELTLFGIIYCILCIFFKVFKIKEIFSILNLKKMA